MNERIKSLIERAEYQAGKHSGSDWEVYVEPSREQIFEKFAEMIVLKCADLFEVEYGQSAVSGNEVAKVLKKHFGVEE